MNGTSRTGRVRALYNTHQCEARLFRPRIVVVEWVWMERWKGGGLLEMGGVGIMVRRKLVGHVGVTRTGRRVGCFTWGWSYADTAGVDIRRGGGVDGGWPRRGRRWLGKEGWEGEQGGVGCGTRGGKGSRAVLTVDRGMGREAGRRWLWKEGWEGEQGGVGGGTRDGKGSRGAMAAK